MILSRPNLFDFLSLIAFLIFFDVVGVKVRNIFISRNNVFRPVDWTFGGSIFIFLIYVLGLFTPVSTIQIYFLGAILIGVCLPSYFSTAKPIDLIKSLKNQKILFFFFIIAVPALITRAAIPPFYSDEAVYHFPNLAYLHNPDWYWAGNWKFDGGLYNMVPRSLNIFYEVVIRVTGKVFDARTINFLLVLSSAVFIGNVFGAIYSSLLGGLIAGLVLLTPESLIFHATTGFVDLPSVAFFWCFVASILLWDEKGGDEYFLAALSFAGIAMGIKYTLLVPITLFIAVASIKIFADRKFILKKKRNYLVGLALFLVLGGYWYVKNLVVTCNPIYPMILPVCRYHDAWLGYKKIFGGGWVTPINLSTLPEILIGISANSWLMFASAVIGIAGLRIDFLKKNLLGWALIVPAAELVIAKFTSGFWLRYFQHMHLYVILFAAIPLVTTNRSKKFSPTWLPSLSLIFLITATIYFFADQVSSAYKSISRPEKHFILGKISGADLLRTKFGAAYNVAEICQERKSSIGITWFSYDVISQTEAPQALYYLEKCIFFDSMPWKTKSFEEVTQRTKSMGTFWYVSTQGCSNIPLTDNEKELDRKLTCAGKELFHEGNVHLYEITF